MQNEPSAGGKVELLSRLYREVSLSGAVEAAVRKGLDETLVLRLGSRSAAVEAVTKRVLSALNQELTDSRGSGSVRG
jgi:hypothetical protein